MVANPFHRAPNLQSFPTYQVPLVNFLYLISSPIFFNNHKNHRSPQKSSKTFGNSWIVTILIQHRTSIANALSPRLCGRNRQSLANEGGWQFFCWPHTCSTTNTYLPLPYVYHNILYLHHTSDFNSFNKWPREGVGPIQWQGRGAPASTITSIPWPCAKWDCFDPDGRWRSKSFVRAQRSRGWAMGKGSKALAPTRGGKRINLPMAEMNKEMGCNCTII